MTADVEHWLQGYREAWERLDADAAARLFTEDASYREHPHQAAHAGQDGIRAYWERVTATQSDVSVRYGRPISDGPRTAVEWWTVMKNGGADVTLSGEFLLIFAADGRCQELREYWHFSEGAIEPPPGWGT